jgi:hypothetical protein
MDLGFWNMDNCRMAIDNFVWKRRFRRWVILTKEKDSRTSQKRGEEKFRVSGKIFRRGEKFTDS